MAEDFNWLYQGSGKENMNKIEKTKQKHYDYQIYKVAYCIEFYVRL
jgi:hypothetical protein